jgi:hypothetical protein
VILASREEAADQFSDSREDAGCANHLLVDYCHTAIASRSKYPPDGGHRCWLRVGHEGAHAEFPFIADLELTDPAVARKIVRDSVMTTGAAWKSSDAGPNRIRRWVMLMPSHDLLERYDIDLDSFGADVRSKLLDKGARYEDCIEVAQKLAWLAYGMSNTPDPSQETRAYLEELFGPIEPGATGCLICKAPLDFELFRMARRGRAAIETAHSAPRSHNAANVGFAHRECNIAQGSKTLDEFYDWIAAILARARP